MARGIIALMAFAAILSYACSDDGGDETPAIPTFTGATLLNDSVLTDENLSTRSWQTTEDVPDVQAYFEQRVPDGGFRVVETRPIEGGVVIIIEDPENPARGGTIIVRRDGDTTRIVETIDEGGGSGDDDEEDEDDDAAGDDVVQGALPPGFPADIALPDDAEIISGSAPRSGEFQFYLVEFTIPGSPADLIAYFNETLPALGWEAGASSESPSAVVLNFFRGDDRVTVTGEGSGEGTNAAMTVVIRE